MRSTREIRKPKKDKAPAKPESTFGSQIKLAGTPAAAQKPKGKT